MPKRLLYPDIFPSFFVLFCHISTITYNAQKHGPVETVETVETVPRVLNLQNFARNCIENLRNYMENLRNYMENLRNYLGMQWLPGKYRSANFHAF